MRRKDKEIPAASAMEAVIRRAKVCRLGLAEGGRPYVVPVCFGYRERTVYIHSALEGRKMDMLRSNPEVCVAFDVDTVVVKGDRPCDWTMRYRSVLGFGRAALVEDPGEKRRALNAIMEHYADPPANGFDYPGAILAKTAVIKVPIDRMTGKQSGYPG